MRLALQAALLLSGGGQFALGLQHTLIQLRMALLAIGQSHVQRFEAAFGGDAALLQVFQLGIHLGQVTRQLGAAGAGLLGQLREPQCFHL